ncbi:THO complex subunit 2 [Pseudocercospora fuligena]|uniref:THO complex subunit 2 n=1 Tax=Pseudocercospora fuligena TaxID=685502 RepID=A0A8H6VED0_9PEZI|nr:THO complex subunit 2 [Pseudocercospora fuligena]
MAPASGKRKRPERQSTEDDGSRASPYRPEKSRLVSRGASQPNGAEQEASGGENAASTPVNGDAPIANGNSLLEPPAESADTPTPALETTPNPDGPGEQAQPSRDLAMDRKPPFRYTVVGDEAVASWAETGRAELLDSANTADDFQLSDLLQELIRSALEGRLTAKQAGHFVRELRTSRQAANSLGVEFLFLNTISLLYDAGYKGEALKTLVSATGIDQQTMRQEFDVGLVQDLGLVRSTFEKMRTRKTTNALYRQANFNLLREESEGYAKLITEYFNTAQEASTRHVDDPYMAENAVQRIMALVGAFDLDVGRVLDITLDVCANLLVRAYPFFMKFYRASPWWPKNELLDNVKSQDQGFANTPAWMLPDSGRSTATDDERQQLAVLKQQRDIAFWDQVRTHGMKAFFELGAKKIVDFEAVLPLLETEALPEVDSRGKEYNPDKRQRINEARRYMKETGCLPPSGNYDAAQLLGFKLRFYASDARDANDILPDNLIYLAALLIKIGFISLRDLYPHLYPSDEDMPKEKERLTKEKKEKEAKDRPGGGINALLTAGALSDDTPAPRAITRIDKEKSGAATPAQDKKDDPKEELPPPANQKLQLLKALLLIGAIPEALYMLGRFPWLAELDVTLPPFLFRIVKHMLSKMSESVLPLADDEELQNSKEQLQDTSARADSTLPFTARPPRKILRWLHNDGFDKDGVEYRHYYGDWNDNVPVCQNVDDVLALCDTFLGYLGPKIGQDASILATILRLAHRSLTEDSSSNNRAKWLKLMRRLLLPALSYGKHKPQLTHQVFELLKMWDTATRYGIYQEWFTGATSRQPDVQVAFSRNKSEVRDVLRRVANDTVKKQGRALAKVALASPGIVVMEMISQLEAYSNMIPSLVECVRYFSPLAYDVLVWALINSLRGEGRGRRQADGMLTSAWLQALARFVATLFARYTHLHPDPILQYLASQLRSGDTTDLEMFDQMLVEMAGIRSDVEFNDVQVLAMAGGEALQSHIMQQLSDNRHSKEKKKSAERLIQALSGPGITGQILIAIAQERQMYQHHEDSRFAPLKVLGNNVDKIAAVFAQYLEVLKTNLKPEDLEAAVPDVGSLATDFGLEPSIALTIRRMVMRSRMTEYDAKRKQEEADEKKEKGDAESADKDGDAAMKEATTPAEVEAKLLDAGSPPDIKVENREGSVEVAETTRTWHPVLEPVIQQLTEQRPDLAERVSIPFYVTFWTLAHQDILVPTDSYQRETNRIEQQIKEIQADRSDMTTVAAKDRDKKKRDLQQWYDRLKSEPMQHMAAYMAVRNRINGHKSGNKIVPGENMFWFPKIEDHDPEKNAKKDARHIALLQECFLPRAMLSALDAHYAFEMLKLMHANGTPGFQLMHLLNQLFKKQELAVLIFQCTANEAQHFARFLWEVLKLLHRWHADKAVYEKEALGLKKKLPGFVKTFDETGEPKTVIDFEDFRRMLFNFHAALNTSLQACFESSEYMHIRNGIIVLKGIHQVFPALKHMGKNMLEQVKRLSEQDPRSDLKLAAMSLRGPLQNREKQWVMPQSFRLGKEGTRPVSRGPSARPETPQPGETPKLNANAPDFKPSSATDGRKESVAGGPEDGEIEDEKIAAAKNADVEMKDTTTDKARASAKEKLPPSRPTQARDTPKVESKPSTPAPTTSRQTPHPSVPQRPESRSSSTRGEQTLPSRPDSAAKPPPYASTPRSGLRNAGRDDHRPRDEHYGRLDRPGEMRPPSRDQSPGHRNGRGRTPPGAASRGSYRDERQAYDRPPSDSRYARDDGRMPRRDELPPRDMPPQQGRYPSDSRDRPQLTSRQSDSHTHPDRMSHVSSVAVAPEPQRPAQPQQDTSMVNPARLANIANDSPSAGRGPRDRPSNERDMRRDRDSRMDDRNAPPMQPRSDSRQNGRMPPDVPRDIQSRAEPQQDLTPRGPRSGRLRNDMGPPQAESSYGRLNGPSEPPSGPKNAPGGRQGRNFTAPGPISTRGNELNAPSPTTARPPESPAALRVPPRQNSGQVQQMDRQSAPNSAPSTPASEEPPVHPSRARQLGQPGPIQTNFPPPNGPRNAASPTSAAPSGPRGSNRNGPPVGTPTGPGPANNMPPTGPATIADRQRRNERQRQMGSINATLQGSNTAGTPGQGVQFRGASSRQSSISQQPSPATRGGPTALASSMEPSQNHSSYEEQGGSRQDLFHRSDRGEDRGRHREEDRANRSHHGSRHPSRERHESQGRQRQPNIPPPPPPPPEEHRDRRQGPRDDRQPRDDRSRDPQARDGPRSDRRQPRADDQPPRRPLPDQSAVFNAPPQGDWQRGQQPPDDGRRGRAGPPTGPGGRSEEFRGQGPMRREEERRGPPRDEAPTAPDGRKRRHEESSGQFEGSKRRRSGR